MIEIDWNPDRRKLRQFGWISLVGFGVIGLVLGWKFGWIAEGKWLVPGILWATGVVAAILGSIEPPLIRPLYWLLTAISAVIGPVIAFIVMALIFLLVFFPIGLFFRLRGRDELCRELHPEAATYWGPKPTEQEPARYFRQY